ncbi:MAG: hypothetical protein JRI68_15910 [Deltaproteobacteria bacterium]|nr:hypothetical protein [Deltaproteobacteria bacterium]
MSVAEQRQGEDQAFREFATRHGLACAPRTAALPIRGQLDGVPLSVAKVRRGSGSNPYPATQFLALAPAHFAGGLVAYKPNFVWRLPGPRRISDDIGRRGLLGFAHHDRMGDRELDKRLVVYADDVEQARARITAPDAKQAILTALDAAGHIRIRDNEVALELSERRSGLVKLLASAEEVETLAFAAVAVIRCLAAPGGDPYRS